MKPLWDLEMFYTSLCIGKKLIVSFYKSCSIIDFKADFFIYTEFLGNLAVLLFLVVRLYFAALWCNY